MEDFFCTTPFITSKLEGTQLAKSPKKKSVAVYFWQYGTYFECRINKNVKHGAYIIFFCTTPRTKWEGTYLAHLEQTPTVTLVVTEDAGWWRCYDEEELWRLY